MQQGAQVLYEKAKDKGAQLILWATRGYRYGFFENSGENQLRKVKSDRLLC